MVDKTELDVTAQKVVRAVYPIRGRETRVFPRYGSTFVFNAETPTVEDYGAFSNWTVYPTFTPQLKQLAYLDWGRLAVPRQSATPPSASAISSAVNQAQIEICYCRRCSLQVRERLEIHGNYGDGRIYYRPHGKRSLASIAVDHYLTNADAIAVNGVYIPSCEDTILAAHFCQGVYAEIEKLGLHPL